MNYVVNDLGKAVVAIGAPGSVQRVAVERPALIISLNFYALCGFPTKDGDFDPFPEEAAIELIKQHGITSALEIESILQNTYYRSVQKNPTGTTTESGSFAWLQF